MSLLDWAESSSQAAAAEVAAYVYERRLVEELLRTIPSMGRAILLSGPRRVGKTLVLKQVLARLRRERAPSWYVDLGNVLLSDPSVLQDLVASVAAGSPDGVLLLDEVHFVPSWGRQLKYALDHHRLRIIVADSCSTILHDNATEALVGRVDIQHVHPFSFPERVALRRAETQIPLTPSDRLFELDSYLALGGFPEHRFATDETIAHARLREDAVAQAVSDVGHVFGTRNPQSVRRLLVGMLAGSGQERGIAETARTLSATEVTVRTWMEQLKGTGLVWELPRHTRSHRKHATAHPKTYATDPALVAACSLEAIGPRRDAVVFGRQVETAVAHALRVFAERRADTRVSYLKTPRGEIDFLVESETHCVGIEVTAGEVRGKVADVALTASSSKLAIDRLIACSPRAERGVARHAGREVHLVPLDELLTALANDQPEGVLW